MVSPALGAAYFLDFCKFYKILTMSKSLAVRVMANISAMDIRSVTGSNLFNIEKEVKLDPVKDPLPSLKKEILALKVSVPVQDSWRLPCLQKFLDRKYALEADHQDTGEIDKLIDSLCMS